MHVLTCPVCQAPMREIGKHGVMIDTCTQCRGVWLDRGELEKLSEVIGSPRAGGFLSGMSSNRRADWRKDDEDDEDDGNRARRGKRSRFLDFFD